MKRVYSKNHPGKDEAPKRRNFTFGHSPNEREIAVVNVSIDTTKVDIFGAAETVFWDTDQETIKAVRTFAVGGTSGNETAVVEIQFINKIAEAADIYFSITPASYRPDLIQSHLDGAGGPVHVAAAPNATTPTTTKLGELARRLGFFGLYWGVVAVPVTTPKA